MISSSHRIARRFLAVGGRFLITPAGTPDLGVDFGPLLSLKMPERERRRRMRIARAARSLVDQRGAAVAAMVRNAGTATGSWIVWEGR